MLHRLIICFLPGTRSRVLYVFWFTQASINKIITLSEQRKGDRITASYLPEAWHLLPVPASFSQGVDGHLAGCWGSLDGTLKCRTEVVTGARHGGCAPSFSSHRAVRSLEAAPSRERAFDDRRFKTTTKRTENNHNSGTDYPMCQPVILKLDWLSDQ